MHVVSKRVTLYVDKASGCWIVHDLEGNYWSLPSTDNPWADRQPYTPADEAALERVPGHYRAMLGLPT
jgi:hypothetical protein